ncbi:anthranilate synthase component 2/putative glutamine amidotransferase [Sinosporangium album]|uniref:Anthranilate synthase component 2/putative glutamine amidotransferase n=1 Tax=Sinosporangium album TaxID=504805 RepID=A0A1G7V8S6_9ACTN|nr:gamma-glutamyl-gamma-aminobutyrate hydrolase family protein [Sinosporangium album]SDG55978.1 anthranilate synthase component 2/putative glutamine amidotransferase [Sinosporangium album]
MNRPLIGITCYIETASFATWHVPSALLPLTYIDKVVDAGGQPVLLPLAGDPAKLVERLDGLIVAGGGDVDPRWYGQAPHPETNYVRRFRDEAEVALVCRAVESDLPFLGICRGLHVLNVAMGGTLHQHLPDLVGHTGHAPAPATFGKLPVLLAPDSRLAAITGSDFLDCSHYHHQAADRLGHGLTVTATAEDGTVEALELDGHPFALAVQWHPEAGDDPSLFNAFVAQANGSA